MKNKTILQIVCAILTLGLLEQAVFADIAPPGPVTYTLSAMAILGLGLLVTVIVFVSFLVIRAIRKRAS